MKAIRDVNHSEELTFEQILIGDNPPSREFLLIDRQVTDHHMHRRLALLGLRRLESGRYGFVVIEVKLGKNRELSEAVAEQLEHYVRHIRDEAPEAYSLLREDLRAEAPPRADYRREHAGRDRDRRQRGRGARRGGRLHAGGQ